MTTPLGQPISLDIIQPDMRAIFAVLRIQTQSHINFTDYEKDINHLFHTICSQYTDVTCVHLHTDELMGEAYLKFSKVWSQGYFSPCRTRADFFARLKTVINNHIKGLVQRYRFTIKRTGIKPPPKGQVPSTQDDFRSTKPVEISLDDPESMLQVSDSETPHIAEELMNDDLIQEIRLTLSPIEQLVFDQSVSPNNQACLAAEMDAERGRGDGRCSIKISVKKSHLAAGIGLDVDTYSNIEKAVSRKVKAFMTIDSDPDLQQREAEFNCAVTVLSTAFNVQIPRGIDKIIIRRAMTLAARRNYDKICPEIIEALTKIGAKVPVTNGLSLNCLGVLYESSNKICAVCGLREQCKVEAATVGLDKITPHPTVLGVKQMRIPTLITEEPPQAPVPNERNDSIMSYLTETFASSMINRDTYFRLRESPTGSRPPMIFCMISSRPTESIQLRFCNPSDELKTKLDKRRNGWYLPDTATAEESFKLIDEHSSQVLESSNE